VRAPNLISPTLFAAAILVGCWTASPPPPAPAVSPPARSPATRAKPPAPAAPAHRPDEAVEDAVLARAIRSSAQDLGSCVNGPLVVLDLDTSTATTLSGPAAEL